MSTDQPKFNRRTRYAAALAVAGLTFAGCGSTSPTGAAAELSELQKSRIAEEWRDCMAEGGLIAEIQYEDGLDISVGSDGDATDEEMMEVEAGCEPILAGLEGTFEIDPDDQARLIDIGADLQKCIADAGYVVRVDAEGGIELNSDDQPDNFDEAAYAEAEEGCYKELVPDLYEKYAE